MHPALVHAPLSGGHSLFLEGPVGAGKTRTGMHRLAYMLDQGVSPHTVLVVVPERQVGHRYRSFLEAGPHPGPLQCQTYYGLALRAVQDFWPHIALEAGFGAPMQDPRFLNFETAQFVLRRIIQPQLDQGYFAGLSIRPQRILSELLDNLNKAAINGYPLEEVGRRLREAWTGDPGRKLDYRHAQHCIELFRSFLLQHNLLDFSLVVDAFNRHLVHHPTYWRYFIQRYRHLIYDNVEETVPVAQDFIRRFTEDGASALLIYDQEAGYRILLGVDAAGAYTLKQTATQQAELTETQHATPALQAVAHHVGFALRQRDTAPPPDLAAAAVKGFIRAPFRAEMVRGVVDQIKILVAQGVPPKDMVVVAPYVDGVLRFTMGEYLEAEGIPYAVVRRYESLREEPVVRVGLTLLALAHPDWGIQVPENDVVELLSGLVDGLDPIRATLLARNLFDPVEQSFRSADGLTGYQYERIGFAAVERYETLRQWLETYRAAPQVEIDYTLRHFFNQVLASPDFPATDARRYQQLIRSMAAFRKIAPQVGVPPEAVGQAYVEMIMDGVVASQYTPEPSSLTEIAEDVVMIAPVQTFLLSGRTVPYQFWLDVGDAGWWEALYQPLTNPHVLARAWPTGAPWTDQADVQQRSRSLYLRVLGLCHRCSKGLYLALSEARIEKQGDNRLLRTLEPLLRSLQPVPPT